MDKLPEKWYIEVTNENADIINKWKFTTEWQNSAIYWKYVDYRGAGQDTGLMDGYTEITFEQFKQFVLKEPIMEKKIIGYKAPITLFGGNIKKDTIYKATSSHPTPQPKFCPIDDSNKPIGGFYYDLPKEIVETWEPVYEEEYKVEDWVLLSNDANGWGSGIYINNQIVQIEEIKTLWGDDILKIFFTFKGKNESTAYKEIVRKATPEEIKVVQIPDITINGYKAVFFDKYVKFGCAEIDNNMLIELDKFLTGSCYGGNRNIQAITIGTGVFSREFISQIANYINRK